MLRHASVFAIVVALSILALSTCVYAQTPSVSDNVCTNQTQKQFRFSALDNTSLIVTGIKREDIVLRRNEVVVPIAKVDDLSEQSIDVALVIDTSASQYGILDVAKTAAERLVRATARPGKDRFAVVSFSNEPSYEQILTADIDVAIKAVKNTEIVTADPLYDIRPRQLPQGFTLDPPNDRMTRGASAIWESTKDVLRMFNSPAETRRRAIVLFTNGDNTVGNTMRDDLVGAAISAGVPIYTVGIADPRFHIEKASLEELSSSTGGIAGFPTTNQEYGRLLTDIARRLRAEYSITYCTSNISMSAPAKLKLMFPERLRARVAYPRREK